MSLWRQLTRGLRVLKNRSAANAEIADEVHDFYERAREDRIREGLSAEDAARAVQRDLGHEEHAREQLGTYGWERVTETMLADFRHALRRLRRSPSFTLIVVLTLAFGIAVNIAVYSLAEQTLFSKLPVPEPDRLVNLSDPGPRIVGQRDPFVMPDGTPGGESMSGGSETLFSYPMFRDLERAQSPFQGLAAHYRIPVSLATDDQARSASAILVSGSYFSVLGLQPALGRLLGPQDDQIDGIAESVVLTYSYWQAEFGGDPDVLGRTIRVDSVPLTIVGVAPSRFNGTTATSSLVDDVASVFVPITMPRATTTGPVPPLVVAPNHERRDFFWVHIFARLKPGITREQATAEINPLFSGILSEVDAPLLVNVDEQQREAFRTRPLVLEPGARGQTNAQILSVIRIALLLLLAVSGFVLLLCCANVAGLMLVRATERTGEMAVRASMGASRRRLASLLLAETLVLALPAALLSLPVALTILRIPSRTAGMPDTEFSIWLKLASEVSLSAAATLVAIGVAVAAALAVGLFPLRSLIRTEPGKALQAYGARQTTTRGVARFRRTLATTQVALSMALLGITFVFAHSITNMTRVDLGLDLDSVTTFRISAVGRFQDPADRETIAEAIAAIPGVSLIAWSSPALLNDSLPYFSMSVRGVEAEPLPVGYYNVSPNLFRMFGIELIAGRELNDTDSGTSVTIVSQRFAEQFGLTPNDAIGRTIDGAWGEPSEIVGVVSDMRTGPITEEIEPRMFQVGGGSTYYVRSARPAEDLMNTVREIVARVDPGLSVSNISTMEQQFFDRIAIQRFAAKTASALAVLATALAALGLYGLLAYSVAQRSREIGMRFALGAPAARIRGMVLRQVTGTAVMGVLLGTIAAWSLGLAAQSLLFSVGPGDPLALAAAAAVLAAIMLGAAYIPARRASRVDPMTVLRYE